MAKIHSNGGLEKWIRDLKERLKSNSVVQVGFMEDKTYPDGTSVALVAAVQDFGAPSRGIPPRPFFRNAIAKGKSSWYEEAKALLKKHDYDVHATLVELGQVVEGDIKRSINETNDPPLKPATIKRKKFDKPLIDTGTMLNSVTSRVVEKG